MENAQWVGRAFALLRRSHGLNQGDVAEALGTSRQAIGLLESKDGNPTVGKLDRALVAIGRTWFDLAVALRAAEAEADLEEVSDGLAAGVGAGELGWLARELLETQRELARSRRQLEELEAEFERLSDAVASTWSREASAAGEGGGR